MIVATKMKENLVTKMKLRKKQRIGYNHSHQNNNIKNGF